MSVFISYRRIDTQQAAGRVADRLIERFGREAVVIDVDTDQVGRDYRTLISEHLEDADVVLALIGPRFMAEGPDGRRRLDQPHDALRLELTRALARNVPVVPVLVDGAELPDPDDLPDDLRDLVFRGSVELAHHRFDRDYSFLEEHVARFLEQAPVSAGLSGSDESPSAAAEREAAEKAEGEAAEKAATENAAPEEPERDRQAHEQEVAAAAEPIAAEEAGARRVTAVEPEEKVPVAEAGPVDTGSTPARAAVWNTSDVPMWGWIVLALLGIGGVVGAAIALSDGAVYDCEDVVDDGILEHQDMLNVWSGVEPEGLPSDVQRAELSVIAASIEELSGTASGLNCDVGELRANIIGRFDELEANGEVAEKELADLKENPAFWGG